MKITAATTPYLKDAELKALYRNAENLDPRAAKAVHREITKRLACYPLRARLALSR